MPLRVDDKDVIRAALSRAVGPGADAAAITEAAATVWERIAAQLEPLIGQGGVQALYGRCLHTQGIAADVPATSATDGASLATLRGHLQGHPPAAALDAAVDFFDCFSALLGSLIGARMTERLLNPVWAEGHTDKPVQENER